MELPKTNQKTRLAHREELEKTVKYAHFYVGFGVVTIAANFNYLRNNYNEVEVFYGMAYCSPKDQWSRRVGREIAFERLLRFDRSGSVFDSHNASQMLTRSLPNVGLMLQRVTFDHLNTHHDYLPNWLKFFIEEGSFYQSDLLFTKTIPYLLPNKNAS